MSGAAAIDATGAARATGAAYRVTAIAAIGGFLFGYDTAVISGTVAPVTARFGLNPGLVGWYVSCALAGCIAGVAYTGVLRDRFGTKPMLIAAALLFTASSIGCMAAGDFTELVLFRLVGGLGIGMASMLSPLYIAEIAPRERRGRLVACYQVAITVGILVAYFVNAALLELGRTTRPAGAVLHAILVDDVWRAMLGSGGVPALLFLALLPTVPESPRWLVARGRRAEAFDVLRRVAGPNAGRELDEIEATVADERGGELSTLLGAYRVPAFLGVALALLQQLSGINAVIYYGPSILERAGLGRGDALGGQVLIGGINVLGTFVAVATVDRFGRRPLLLGGAVGIFFSLVAISALFIAGVTNGAALLVALMAFIAFFALSYGPVVWILLSEIFPTRVRGIAMSVATVALWVGTMLVGQATPMLLAAAGPGVTFAVFAICTLPAIYLALRVLPETRGRSLEEIERSWLNR